MIIHFPRQHYGDFAVREGCIRNEHKRENIPQWLRRLPKPAGVIGYSADQVGCFLWSWNLRPQYKGVVSVYPFSLDNGQSDDLCDKLSRGNVLFVLPYGGWMSEMTMMAELRANAEAQGIVTVQVPMNIARGEPWPIEMSMVISTRIEIAKQHSQLSLDARPRA